MESNLILATENLKLGYSRKETVRNINLRIRENTVTGMIGPSGCGKSTLLRTFNRMNDFIPEFSVMGGRLLYRSMDIYDSKIDPVFIRRKIGMVFQKPNPFPSSIFNNVSWGPKINGYQGSLHDLVESSLQRAALWNEVKDKLDSSGLSLSGGQQQRLCIARAIAMNPDVILMDEPCSALDPASTARIEQLITELKEKFTILIVTHNMQQAARVSDETAFMFQGDLVEYGPTKLLFNKPKERLTEDYIMGRFG